MKQYEGRQRVIIEGVKPEVDGGRFDVKRTVGEKVVVEADIFTDGHDSISAVLLHRKASEKDWKETPMTFVVNDRWRGTFNVTEQGRYVYSLTAWVDHFKSWRLGMRKKVDAEQDVGVDLLIGAQLIEETAQRASMPDAKRLQGVVDTLRSSKTPLIEKIEAALNDEIADTMLANSDRAYAVSYLGQLGVRVDRERARFSTWYEMFPRSTSPEPGRYGTFRDAETRLPYIAGMGFDVLYLPPIHPIGKVNRKGKNNVTNAAPDDTGSPWAIGSDEGGHKSIDPRLGTLEDFQFFVAKAREHGIEVAMDIAFQCAPDHPYVKEHPEWFRWRPDGTVQYAENPPKKYEDIYPFNFDIEHWKELWDELTSIVLYWVEQGVNMFRVDNPHTKSYHFWEYLIDKVKSQHPQVLFLAEAFTRPKVMYYLAKLGFTQSYTYFTWRNTRWELTQYLTELTQTDVKEYFRPNFWPNTPDILNEYLQFGGRPAFMARLVLAATMTACYGMYGPPFELYERNPREPGSEEYLDSEKYQLRHWDVSRPDSLHDLIARMNRIRRQNRALQSNDNLRFHPVSNEQLICYSKRTDDHSNVILTVVNVDPHHTQSGWVNLDLEELGLVPNEPYQVHDLLGDGRYLWHGSSNYVELNPHVIPAHVFRLRRRARSEQDFDYFM
jgi:starch synthase (maltosyl-transferring)